MAPGDTIKLTFGWGNSLLPDGTKPSSEPKLPYHQWGLMTFTWCHFDKRCSNKQRLKWVWNLHIKFHSHYGDAIMSPMASQTTSLTIVSSNVYAGANQSSMSLAFVQGIHRWPVNSPHKEPVTQKMFPFDDIIMYNPEANELSHIEFFLYELPLTQRTSTLLYGFLVQTLHSTTLLSIFTNHSS